MAKAAVTAHTAGETDIPGAVEAADLQPVVHEGGPPAGDSHQRIKYRQN